jgi:hypothetical protein
LTGSGALIAMPLPIVPPFWRDLYHSTSFAVECGTV